MVLITVLLFGIHFSEALWVAMKAQEAVAAAKWDATALRAYTLPGDYRQAPNVAKRAAQLATERYEDFDGRTSVQHGRSGLQQVAAAASNLEVECELAQDVRFPRGPLPPRLAAVYQDVGGIRCHARADTWLTRIPQTFADRGSAGLFAAQHVFGTQRYHACGFGKPFAANCPDGPSLMLGDWGLSGFDEGQECYLSMGDACPNQSYYRAVQAVYEAGGGGKGTAAMTMARSIVGMSPIDANQFWFSFRGEESEFLECVPPTNGEGPNKWETSPGLNSPVHEYHDAYNMRGNCALGWPQDPHTGQCPDRGW